MAFQAPFDIVDMRNQMMREEMMKQQQQQQMFDLIGGAIDDVVGAYSGWRDRKNMANAMDRGVGLMSDIGAIQPDIRDKFMSLNEREKPFVFDLLRQGMFAPYSAGQSAAAQAQAWDKYKKNWPASGGPQPFIY